MSLPSCFDCGRVEPPACLFTDYLSKMQGSSKSKGSKNCLKKNRKSANVCTSYTARASKVKPETSAHCFSNEITFGKQKQQKDCENHSPKQDFSKQRKDRQNYQFQDLKRSYSAKRMEVINEEQNDCDSSIDNEGSFDSVAGKNFQDSCADFLSIVHDTVVDSVRSCVDNNLHDYFCQSIEKMETMYSQMMRNECLLSKMYLDLVERLQRISDKNQKQCEAIYKMITQVNDTLDNGSVDDKDRGADGAERHLAMKGLQAELLNCLPQLPIMDPSKLLQMSMKSGNEIQGGNCMNVNQNMGGMPGGLGVDGALSTGKMDSNMCGNMTRSAYCASANANGNNMNMNPCGMPNLESVMNPNINRTPFMPNPAVFPGCAGMQQMGPSASGYGNAYANFMFPSANNDYANYGSPFNFPNSGIAQQDKPGGKCKGAENENECSCCVQMQKILQCQMLKNQLAASKAAQDAENDAANQNGLKMSASQLAALNAQKNANSNGFGNGSGNGSGNGNRSGSRISLKSVIYDETDGTQTEQSIMDTEPIKRPIRPPMTTSSTRR